MLHGTVHESGSNQQERTGTSAYYKWVQRSNMVLKEYSNVLQLISDHCVCNVCVITAVKDFKNRKPRFLENLTTNKSLRAVVFSYLVIALTRKASLSESVNYTDLELNLTEESI